MTLWEILGALRRGQGIREHGARADRRLYRNVAHQFLLRSAQRAILRLGRQAASC